MKLNYLGLMTFIRRECARMFRVAVQVFVSPLISAFLFIFIFGFVLGKKIDLIAGVPYMHFVFPGILMMNIIQSSFLHTSSAVYFARFTRAIEEILVAPLSHFEMITGYIVSALVRVLVIALGIGIVGFLFGAVSFVHFFAFLFYALGIAIIFALLGIMVGLWANGFEQLNVLNTFIIMPLSFLGGMFYSVELLPPALRMVTEANPFFYFIDGMRYAMIGVHESHLATGVAITLGLMAGFGVLVWYLFKISWRLRE